VAALVRIIKDASSSPTKEQPGAVRREGCPLSGAIKLTTVATPFGDVGISAIPADPRVHRPEVDADRGRTGLCLPGAVRQAGRDSQRARQGRRYRHLLVCPDGQSPHPCDATRFRYSLARDLVRALRTTACGLFTTLLGPGSDSAHEEHLHFDGYAWRHAITASANDLFVTSSPRTMIRPLVPTSCHHGLTHRTLRDARRSDPCNVNFHGQRSLFASCVRNVTRPEFVSVVAVKVVTGEQA
jgi:hypothetical protein